MAGREGFAESDLSDMTICEVSSEYITSDETFGWRLTPHSSIQHIPHRDSSGWEGAILSLREGPLVEPPTLPSSSVSTDQLTSLPYELKLRLFSLLPSAADRGSLAAVNREFAAFLTNKRSWQDYHQTTGDQITLDVSAATFRNTDTDGFFGLKACYTISGSCSCDWPFVCTDCIHSFGCLVTRGSVSDRIAKVVNVVTTIARGKRLILFVDVNLGPFVSVLAACCNGCRFSSIQAPVKLSLSLSLSLSIYLSLSLSCARMYSFVKTEVLHLLTLTAHIQYVHTYILQIPFRLWTLWS